MKKIVYLIGAILSTAIAQAKPNVTWDDPNVAGSIAHYIVYEKITTAGTTTWKPIWKVVGTKVFNLPATNITKTYTVSAINTLGVEGPKSNELTIQAPVALQNFRPVP